MPDEILGGELIIKIWQAAHTDRKTEGQTCTKRRGSSAPSAQPARNATTASKRATCALSVRSCNLVPVVSCAFASCAPQNCITLRCKRGCAHTRPASKTRHVDSACLDVRPLCVWTRQRLLFPPTELPSKTLRLYLLTRS